MATAHKTSREDEVIVTFRTQRGLVHDFRAAIAGEQRTVSQALRLHMADRVNDARAKGELEDVAAA